MKLRASLACGRSLAPAVTACAMPREAWTSFSSAVTNVTATAAAATLSAAPLRAVNAIAAKTAR